MSSVKVRDRPIFVFLVVCVNTLVQEQLFVKIVSK